MTNTQHLRETSWTRSLLTKVPEVTVLFWIVKILSTTVGETAADFLSASRHAGGLGCVGWFTVADRRATPELVPVG